MQLSHQLNLTTLRNVVTEKSFYTVNDVANILDVSRKSVYRLVGEGCFNIVRIGTTIRISKHSFEEWLKAMMNQRSD